MKVDGDYVMNYLISRLPVLKRAESHDGGGKSVSGYLYSLLASIYRPIA